MKKIQKIAMLAVLVPVLVLSSCTNEFLTRTPTTALDTNVVLNDPDLLPTTVVGSMSMFSGAGFMGRNAVVGGELMTDVAVTMGKSNHLVNFEQWNIFPNDADLENYWAYCYSIAASAAQTVYSAKKMLKENSELTDDQKKNLQNAIAVSDVIKAYCDFFLIQNFCVDINLPDYLVPGKRKETKVGILLIKDQPLQVSDEKANMSTLKAAYNWIEQELDEAVAYFDESKTKDYFDASQKRYFPTLCAAYVMQARVFLAQHKYEEAKTAANNALSNLPSGASTTFYSTYDDLLKAYKSTSPTTEDIWTLNYTSQENLSANSLQNFFQAYNGKISEKIRNLFSASDIRKGLYPTQPGETSCCQKYANANAVFNVPVMRVPELYLILAECAAGEGSGDNATMCDNLYKILQYRDPAVTGPEKVTGAPYNYGSKTDKRDMINIVLDERVKELCGEGFRWGDLRRNSNYGVRLNREAKYSSTGSKTDVFLMHFKNFNIARYALPVPYMETSSQQWANGKGVFDDGREDSENWQNNAWDTKEGDNYTLSDTRLQPSEEKDMAIDEDDTK